MALNYNYGDTVRVDANVNIHDAEQYDEARTPEVKIQIYIPFVGKRWITIWPETLWWASKGFKYYKTLTNCTFNIKSGLGLLNPEVIMGLLPGPQQADLNFFEIVGSFFNTFGDPTAVGTTTAIYTTCSPALDSFMRSKNSGEKTTISMTLNGTPSNRIYYEARGWDAVPVGVVAVGVVAAAAVVALSIFTAGAFSGVVAAVVGIATGLACLTALWLLQTFLDRYPNNTALRNLFMF